MCVRSIHMNDILVLPTGALADASLAIVRSSVSRPIVDHSIRSLDRKSTRLNSSH